MFPLSICSIFEGCERAFSVMEGAVVEGAWDGHLLGASHARRVASLAKNKLGESFELGLIFAQQ